MNSKVYIAGHRGLAGSAIWNQLEKEGFRNLIGASSSQLDLRDQSKTAAFILSEKPDVVVLSAAKVGGILANSESPYTFLSDNLKIQVNVFESALQAGVERLLFLGSSCIYPKMAPQPITEDALLTGPLEPTNDGYAIAKIAGVFQVQTVRRQFQKDWIAAMPTNLYGPGDNFSERNSHVLAALIRRFHAAKMDDSGSVSVWGSGKALREFLYVDDFGSAVSFILENYHEFAPLNVGSGFEISIGDLAHLIAEIVGFGGSILFDESKPDGTPRKFLDSSRLAAMGWRAQTDLEEGIRKTYAWYLDNLETARAV